ncbi:glycoprotein 3-alpha-L-fucosyltransferase A-like [Tubulanus polymorphus]|uniref:glycoprotein 3-alpha-L-fucosyltransferase A-like n=1 Tax=Tubulanus polymorphus TaxID=672921 RepID=UPI003DA3EC17
MRLHLARFLYRFVLTCVLVIIPINLYLGFLQKQQGLAQREPPWGRDFNRERYAKSAVRKYSFARGNERGDAANVAAPPIPGTKSKFGSIELLKHEKISNSLDIGPIWPELDIYSDRIVTQMRHMPNRTQYEKRKPDDAQKLKTILAWSGLRSMETGRRRFLTDNCPVNQCVLTSDRSKAGTADVILFNNYISKPPGPRPADQIWALYLLESPYHTPSLSAQRSNVNWTCTYRRESTIVTPYEKFVLFNDSVNSRPLLKNYAAEKTKQVAWFVSNCGARNGRSNYAKELAKHIGVDVYGGCGPKKCPRHQAHKCFDLLNKQYKFYLAFENSNCRDYITEKFFVNGLSHDVVPIVMGAHKIDYERAAPRHSFIHVDDFESPQHLAAYLHKLDKNDALYNEYFRWKGTGRFINTYFWCRLCTMANADDALKRRSYADIENWWRGPGVCNGKSRWTEATYGKMWS